MAPSQAGCAALGARIGEPLKVSLSELNVTPFSAAHVFDHFPRKVEMSPRKVAVPPGLTAPPGLHRSCPLYPRDASPASTCAGSQVSCSDGESEGVLDKSERTTLILKNLPPQFSRAMLLSFLDRHGLGYNLVYMPLDFQTAEAFGWASVNFVDVEGADLCLDCLQGFSEWELSWGERLEVTVSPEQGYEAMAAKFRDLAVMHAGVPDEYKPAAFARDGSRVPLPPSTKRLRYPRNLRFRQ